MFLTTPGAYSKPLPLPGFPRSFSCIPAAWSRGRQREHDSSGLRIQVMPSASRTRCWKLCDLFLALLRRAFPEPFPSLSISGILWPNKSFRASNFIDISNRIRSRMLIILHMILLKRSTFSIAYIKSIPLRWSLWPAISGMAFRAPFPRWCRISKETSMSKPF